MTAAFDDAFDSPVEQLVEQHVATRPWERVERMLTGRVSKDDVVEMLVALNTPPLLSAFLVQSATTMSMGEHATHEYCGYLLTGRTPDDAVRDVMSGEGPSKPSKLRVVQGLSIANKTIKVEQTSGAFTAMAWLNWAMGAPLTGGQYAEKALQLNPEVALAKQMYLMGQMDEQPEWSRRH